VGKIDLEKWGTSAKKKWGTRKVGNAKSGDHISRSGERKTIPLNIIKNI